MASSAPSEPGPLTAQESSRVRQRIFHHFTKCHGLTVSVDVVAFLLDVFRNVPPHLVDETLDLVINAYQQQNGTAARGRRHLRRRAHAKPAARLGICTCSGAPAVASTIVDLAVLQQVVQGMIRHESTDSIAELRRRVEVINVFDVPAYRYSQERRTFVQVTGPRRLFGDATDKAEYLRERFEVHKQKLLRHALFTAPVSGDVENAALRVRPARRCGVRRGRASAHALGRFLAAPALRGGQITPIQALVGMPGNCIIFGYLVQRKEGVFTLEDADTYVELDLREAVRGAATRPTGAAAAGGN